MAKQKPQPYGTGQERAAVDRIVTSQKVENREIYLLLEKYRLR
jgi:hypothetical protein